LIGMEATATVRGFVELARDLGHEIWVGDCGADRAKATGANRRRTNGMRPILKLMVGKGGFRGLWTRTRSSARAAVGVRHRHKLVEIRSRVKNELQHFL